MAFSLSAGRPLPRRYKLLLCLALAAAAAFFLRRALTQLLFQISLAALIAWAASPLCRRLEKRFPPGLAALFSLLAFLAVVILFLLFLIPQLVREISLALSAVPQLISLVQTTLEKLTSSAFFTGISAYISPPGDLIKKAGDMLLTVIPRLAQWLGRIANRLLRAFLSPALAYYFLRDRETFCFQLSLLVPLRIRKDFLLTLREMRREVAGYFRGQLLVSGSVGLLTALALFLLGTPSFLALGILMGVCDLIPYIGPWIGAVPIVLFSLPQGINVVLWAILAILAIQQTENLLLAPHFMAGATGLHPAYVLLLLSFGGLIGGLGGMLLSLPLFICLRGALRALHLASPRPN